jgi:uracil-DNA glycosylase
MKKMDIKEINLSENFKYESFEPGNTNFVPIHHPGYIHIYKRKYLNKYIESIPAHWRSSVCFEYQVALK